MAKVNWTKAQRSAIETTGGTLLVSAAAGSGKTAVLVERVIETVIAPGSKVNVDDYLLVTFTNAAAAQMRARISQAVADKLEQDPDNAHLAAQLVRMNKAKICTLHAFCLDIVRANFSLLGIPADFRIADPTEISLFAQGVLDEVLDAFYEQSAENGFDRVVDVFSSARDDRRLVEVLLQLHGYIQSHAAPLAWLRDKVVLYRDIAADAFAASRWGEALFAYLDDALRYIKKNTATALAALVGDEAMSKAYGDAFADDAHTAERLAELAAARDYDGIRDFLAAYKPVSLKALNHYPQQQKKEFVTALRQTTKDMLQKELPKLFFTSLEAAIGDVHELYPVLNTLYEVLSRFEAEYTRQKLERGILEFNDLEHYALRLLIEGYDEKKGRYQTTALARRLSERFHEIMVDEYQDINEVQDLILRAVSREESNLFMVGDVKQSIYAFRRAMPAIFTAKKDTYAPLAAGAFPAKIILGQNFRSDARILSLVNDVFAALMSRKFGELDYNEEERLYPGLPVLAPDIERERGNAGDTCAGERAADRPAGERADTGREDGPKQDDAWPDMPDAASLSEEAAVSFYLLDTKAENAPETEHAGIPAGEVGGVDLEELGREEREAHFIACKIRRLIDEKTLIGSGDQVRELRYRDIVVLLRSTVGRLPVYERAFAAYRVPNFADATSGYLAATEVTAMIAVLKTIDNPRQDIPLVAAMYSPIFSFSADELAYIRAGCQDGPFIEAVRAAAQGGDDKCRDFLNKLDAYKRASLVLSAHELVWHILSESGYLYMVGAMPDGARRKANLKMLFTYARAFEATSYKGLFSFVNYLDKIMEKGDDLAPAKITAAGGDVVQVMSIHKSKGLEFPVVFVAGLGKSINTMDLRAPLLIHSALGLGPKYRDTAKMREFSTLPRECIAAYLKRESYAEEARILYVAMTRAKARLYLTLGGENLPGRIAALSALAMNRDDNGKLDAFALGRTTHVGDWLIAALCDHPDFAPVLARTGMKLAVRAASSRFYAHYYDAVQLAAYLALQPEAEREKQSAAVPLAAYEKEIARRLNYRYPDQMLSKIPAKLSVSELKGRAYLEEDGEKVVAPPRRLARPAFLQAEKLTPAERGTALHKFMQFADVFDIQSAAAVRKQRDLLVSGGFLTVLEGESLDIGKILAFSTGALAARMRASKQVYREYRFNMELDANVYEPDLPADFAEQKILVQGVIDCFFREGAGFVLVDYKSDRMRHTPLETLKKRYRGQLALYRQAIETLTGVPVLACYLYSFDLGEVIEM